MNLGGMWGLEGGAGLSDLAGGCGRVGAAGLADRVCWSVVTHGTDSTSVLPTGSSEDCNLRGRVPEEGLTQQKGRCICHREIFLGFGGFLAWRMRATLDDVKTTEVCVESNKPASAVVSAWVHSGLRGWRANMEDEIIATWLDHGGTSFHPYFPCIRHGPRFDA